MKLNVPISSGGLNLRDALDNMPANDTIQQDNIISDVNADRVRTGFIDISKKEGDPDYGAYNLLGFNEEGKEAILSCDTGVIYKQETDYSRTLLKAGLSSDDWLQSSFTDAAGNISVFIANGIDTPQRIYDNVGTLTVATAGYTFGVVTNLDCPLAFKNRMYFFKKDTFKIYYGGVDAIAGAITEFNTSAIFGLGGSIMRIDNWTQDAGDGNDNQFVIITTEGEVAVYQGSSPADWSLKGVYRISRPIGKRCALRFGGDLIIVTEQGFLPLSLVLSNDRANRVNVSDKINPIVQGKDFTKNWSIHWYSKEGWILINAPSTTQYQYEQYCYNSKTGAWCRFVGMDALNWLVQNDSIYFCNQNGVYKANEGNSDNGLEIKFYKQQAYTQFDIADIKQVLRLKVRDNTKGRLSIGKRLGVDFKLFQETQVEISTTGISSLWDVAKWDESFWSSENAIEQYKVSSVSRPGNYISIGILGNTIYPFEMYSTEVLLKVGNGEVW